MDGRRTLLTEYVEGDVGEELTYFVAVVDGTEGDYLMMIWCPTAVQDNVRPEFRRILSTFRELE